MYLGNDDLPASNDSQNMHSPKIKKEKQNKQLLHKLDFTGEEIVNFKKFQN